MDKEKIDWMYKGIAGLVDREDYLTGRKIDKTFEILQREEAAASGRGGSKGDFSVDQNDFTKSLFDRNASAPSTVTIDLSNKVREDPLFEIKKKQAEERKKLMDNPIKMKRIKQLLRAVISRDDDDDDDDGGGGGGSSDSSDDSSSSSGSSSDGSDRKRKCRKTMKISKEKHKHRKRSKNKYRSGSSSPDARADDRHRRDRKDEDASKSKKSDHHRRRPSGSSRQDRGSRRGESRNKESTKHSSRDSRIKRSRSRSRSRNRIPKSSRESMPAREKPIKDSKPERVKPRKPEKRKLTEEEMERKRKEMMEDAAWREEQRKQRVLNFAKEDAEESEKNAQGKSAQFIKPLISSSIESTSLEKRVKQKIFTAQRGYNAMDKNFARK